MIKVITILLIINLVLIVILMKRKKSQRSIYGEIDIYRVLSGRSDKLGD
ncbi:hypothetical protein [Orenia marismortui]|nr:hypothetical protein [Orenia marismortui]